MTRSKQISSASCDDRKLCVIYLKRFDGKVDVQGYVDSQDLATKACVDLRKRWCGNDALWITADWYDVEPYASPVEA